MEHAPFRPRLSPEQRVEMARRFVEEHAPGSALVSSEASPSLTRAVFQKGHLLISFRWLESVGTLCFGYAGRPQDYYWLDEFEIAFGWRAASEKPTLLPEHLDVVMERAKGRLAELEALLSPERHFQTATALAAARKAISESIRKALAPREVVQAQERETLWQALKRSWGELLQDLRLRRPPEPQSGTPGSRISDVSGRLARDDKRRKIP